jgi:hypothetical protein
MFRTPAVVTLEIAPTSAARAVVFLLPSQPQAACGEGLSLTARAAVSVVVRQVRVSALEG